MSIPLPRSPDGLTAEWVTQALQQNYPGVEVTSLRQGTVIGGTGTKIQLLLEYNDIGQAAGLPPALYAKGGFEWHAVAFATSYIAEAIFYADWAPGMAANIPSCYFAGYDEGQGIVLIEDLGLRHVRFGGGQVEPLDATTVSQTLRLLASIHAATWNQPRLAKLRTLGQRVGTNFIDHFLAPDYYAQCLAAPKGSHIPKTFHDPARMLAGLRANWAQAESGPQSFCHGDAHMGNLFFEADGTPGLLDFQASTTRTPDGKVVRDIDLPSSDVVQFHLEDGSVVTVRPSGTEPKIKFYASCRSAAGQPLEQATHKVLATIETLKAALDSWIS